MQFSSTTTKTEMGDKENLKDLLGTQKYLSQTYNTFAGECQCPQLKDELLNIMRDEQQIQHEIFTEMQSHGWYPTKPADVNEVNTTKQKYMSGS